MNKNKIAEKIARDRVAKELVDGDIRHPFYELGDKISEVNDVIVEGDSTSNDRKLKKCISNVSKAYNDMYSIPLQKVIKNI